MTSAVRVWAAYGCNPTTEVGPGDSVHAARLIVRPRNDYCCRRLSSRRTASSMTSSSLQKAKRTRDRPVAGSS